MGSLSKERALSDRQGPAGSLIVLCPKTCATVDTGIATDYKSLAKSWERIVHVACPHCGKRHDVKVRDAFIRGAVSDIALHGCR
jgi:hypothetical protein